MASITEVGWGSSAPVLRGIGSTLCAMKLWEHTPAELAVIPVPDLALLVLADFRESDGWHEGNWINEANQTSENT